MSQAATAESRKYGPAAVAQLTERERQVVAGVCRGLANKVIAYDLGVATSTIAGHLAAAMDKLGVRSRLRLIRLLHAASAPSGAAAAVAPSPPRWQRLSPAERQIARSVVDGDSNRQIASARGRSPRTVANQLRNIYDKVGVGSRAELTVCFTRLAK